MDYHESANLESSPIAHAILGMRMNIEVSSTGKQTMYILISGFHIFCFRVLFIFKWCRWSYGPRWLQLWVEVHPCICTPSISVDLLLCHFGQEVNRLFDFCHPLPGVYQLQPSAFNAQVTSHPAWSLLGLRRQVSCLVVPFPLLQHTITLLWSF